MIGSECGFRGVMFWALKLRTGLSFGSGENGSHSSASHDIGSSLEDGGADEAFEVGLVTVDTGLSFVTGFDGIQEDLVTACVRGFAVVVFLSLSLNAELPTGSEGKATHSSASQNIFAAGDSSPDIRGSVLATGSSIWIFSRDSRPAHGSYCWCRSGICW